MQRTGRRVSGFCMSGFYGEIYMGEIFYKSLGETSGRVWAHSVG